MPVSQPLTLLCITTYEKGQDFMRECKRQGCRVLLVTAEKFARCRLAAGKPGRDVLSSKRTAACRDCAGGDASGANDRESTASWRWMNSIWKEPPRPCANICACLAWGLTTMRYFRDKLAMRMRALDHGLRVPDFVPVIHHDDIRYYLDHVAGPWVLKPRQEASAIGIRRFRSAEELWPVLEQLGDKQSSYLLEKFVPGDVYHVDSVVSENEVVFANVSKYGKPPMNVAQGGGVFTTFTLPRGSEADSRLREINRELIAALGLVRGVAHAELIRADEDGEFYFLECAARVGGAYINEMVEAATGINLWREWARIEIAGGDGSYRLPKVREDYAGVVLSLARQEDPDTSGYNDPEVVLRIKRHHMLD